ncbi:MAG: hypothetical protein CMM58_11960 [Rhodospirillaceae bacterium]|nr:hypothetical protein [Rhodospirillaceae bacterium]|tara:strand:+ start:1020 stop:1223 length:204 start_codon:yes stop_codon:yes gene_type:complete
MQQSKHILKTRKPKEVVLKQDGAPVSKANELETDTDKHESEKELGGYNGPEPTRYGDWEHNGRCTDF